MGQRGNPGKAIPSSAWRTRGVRGGERRIGHFCSLTSRDNYHTKRLIYPWSGKKKYAWDLTKGGFGVYHDLDKAAHARYVALS
jgi:hypothetical protein